MISSSQVALWYAFSSLRVPQSTNNMTFVHKVRHLDNARPLSFDVFVEYWYMSTTLAVSPSYGLDDFRNNFALPGPSYHTST
jgi:hypothetical protein